MRVAWRRRFFPGWSPPAPALTPDFISREILLQLENNLRFARFVNRDYEREFLAGDAWAPRAGETLLVRRPARFSSLKT